MGRVDRQHRIRSEKPPDVLCLGSQPPLDGGIELLERLDNDAPLLLSVVVAKCGDRSAVHFHGRVQPAASPLDATRVSWRYDEVPIAVAEEIRVEMRQQADDLLLAGILAG